MEIPVLVGESLDNARRTLADRQLQVGAVERKPKAGVARDTVLQEFPVAGERVNSGSKVDLIVSDAPDSPIARVGKSVSGRETLGSAPTERNPASSSPHPGQSLADQTTSDQQATKLTANHARTNQAVVETPAEVVNPPDQIVNIGGTWHDTSGAITMELSQRGKTFKFTCSSMAGTTNGSGTISGLTFENSYSNFYTKGGSSTGHCTGTISPNGKRLRAVCADTVSGLQDITYWR